MAFHSSSMLSAPFTCSLSMLDGFTWCGDFFSFALRARLSHSQVAGPSMVPTMAVTGEWVLETRWISAKKLSRGDLVTYVSPLDPSRVVCKRLIGLPGDVVCVDPTGTAAPSTEHVVIPKGHVWLAGQCRSFQRFEDVWSSLDVPYQGQVGREGKQQHLQSSFPYLFRPRCRFGPSKTPQYSEITSLI